MKNTHIGFTIMLGFYVALGTTQLSRGQIFDPATESAAIESTATEVQQAGGADEQSGVVEQTSWPSIPLPKISMPQITLPRLWPSTEDDRPALLAPFAAGFTKLSEGTKKAWEGTKRYFFGWRKAASQPNNSHKVATFVLEATNWADTTKNYDDGPQTVGEFMSQKRLDP